MITHEELSLLRSQNAHVYIQTGYHPILKRVVERSEVEALRGIYRDSQGKIIRSQEWKLERARDLRRRRQEYLDRAGRCTLLLIELEGPKVLESLPGTALDSSSDQPSPSSSSPVSWQKLLNFLGLR